MIEEVGNVVELKGKHLAVVHGEKGSFCKHCASMENCRIGDDNRSMLVEAHNPIGASVGDRVKIITSSRSFLQSSFILYIVPLLALVLGAILGNLIGQRLDTPLDPDLFSAIFGTTFLVGSFFVIRVGSRAIPRENYLPRIAEILPEEEVFVKDLKKNGH